MLVRDKQTDQISVVGLKRSWLQVWKFMWERIVIWSANRFQRYHLFDVDIANTGTDITSLPEFRQADVIHLHWINQGMLSLKDIRKILTSGKISEAVKSIASRYLPLCTRMYELSTGVPQLPVHLQRR